MSIKEDDKKRVTFTLSEILSSCNDWEEFCEKKGWNVYAVNEGGGHVEVSLTLTEVKEFGLM